MNYLAHYYFNAIQKNVPGGDFHFGVALPDLVSGYDRRFRFHLSRVELELNGSENRALWLGVKNHLATDAFFHQSQFFKRSYDAVRQLCIRSLPRELNVRVFFLAHIAVEILLDHALLKSHPALANEFYTALSRTSGTAARTVLEDFFGHPLDRFDIFVNKFMVLRFLESYIDLQNVIGAMNRMLARARQAPITELSFHSVLEEALETIETNFSIIADEVSSFQRS